MVNYLCKNIDYVWISYRTGTMLKIRKLLVCKWLKHICKSRTELVDKPQLEEDQICLSLIDLGHQNLLAARVHSQEQCHTDFL